MTNTFIRFIFKFESLQENKEKLNKLTYLKNKLNSDIF